MLGNHVIIFYSIMKCILSLSQGQNMHIIIIIIIIMNIIITPIIIYQLRQKLVFWSVTIYVVVGLCCLRG